MSTSPPKLPTTTAEASEYAPYSLTAILAVGVAGLFAVLLLALGLAAFRAGQPFLQPALLALPAAAVVLAFAARRQILSSEGTKDGLTLATAAWWIAVVGGLGYTAYLMAIGFAIRQDAAGRFQEWATHVADIDPNDPRDPALFRAFSTTVEPARQDSLGPTKIDAILRERREELAWFRQCDLVRYATRNKGETTFLADALQSWELDPQQALQCALNARLRSPEGEYTLLVSMTRQQVEGRPVWQVKPTGPFVKAANLTRYGQYLQDMEVSAVAYALGEVLPTYTTHALSPGTLAGLTQANPPGYARRSDYTALARGAVVGGYGWLAPANPADEAAVTGPLFRCPDPTREASARQRFQTMLLSGRVAPPGMLSQSTMEMSSLTTVTPGRVEVKVPAEMQVIPTEMACRGYVVVACDDPASVAKLAELKAAAAGDPLKPFQPGVNPPVPWKLVRFESDLKPMPPPRRGDGGGGGPNVPGMPNMGTTD